MPRSNTELNPAVDADNNSKLNVAIEANNKSERRNTVVFHPSIEGGLGHHRHYRSSVVGHHHRHLSTSFSVVSSGSNTSRKSTISHGGRRQMHPEMRRRCKTVKDYVFCFTIGSFHYISKYNPAKPTDYDLDLVEDDGSGSGATEESIIQYFRMFWRKIPESVIVRLVREALCAAVVIGYLVKDSNDVYHHLEEAPPATPAEPEPPVYTRHVCLAERVGRLLKQKQRDRESARRLLIQATMLQEWRVRHALDKPVMKDVSAIKKVRLTPKPKLVQLKMMWGDSFTQTMVTLRSQGEFDTQI